MAYNAGEPLSSNFKTLLIFLVIHSVSKYLRIDSSLHYSRLYSNSSSLLWPVGGERIKNFFSCYLDQSKKIGERCVSGTGKVFTYEICHSMLL